MEKKVLIVDDNHFAVDGIYNNIDWKALSIIKIFQLYDSESASECIIKEKVDIIISDVQMPGLNGIDLSKLAVSQNRFAKTILVSAYDKFEYAKQALRAGAYDYIEKPINYDYLQSMIQKASEKIDQEYNDLQMLESSRPALADKFFRMLLFSNHKEYVNEIDLYQKFLELNLDYDNYCVIKISIDDINNINSALGLETYHLKFMKLANKIEDIGKEFLFHYTINDLNAFFVIVANSGQSKKAFHQSLHISMENLSGAFEGELPVIIGIGTITNLNNLSTSLNGAESALGYRFFFPQNNVFEDSDYTGREIPEEFFRPIDEKKLIQLICKNDKSGVDEWINSFSTHISKIGQNRNIVFSMTYDVLIHVLSFLYEMNIDTSTVEKQIFNMYGNLSQMNNNIEVFKKMKDIISTICVLLKDSTGSYQDSVCDTVNAYVRNNYNNVELSLNEIANYAGLSSSHLSALYKKHTGTNISDLITSVRIEKACDLIKHSSFSLKEISEKTGYINQYYFSTCFKKITGVAPSAYRDTETD